MMALLEMLSHGLFEELLNQIDNIPKTTTTPHKNHHFSNSLCSNLTLSKPLESNDVKRPTSTRERHIQALKLHRESAFRRI